MDVTLIDELLKLAKKNIELGVEAVELVTLHDGERGKFYGRTIAEYIRDALIGANGLDNYIEDIRKEIASIKPVALPWDQVQLEPDYVPVPIGEKIKLGDHIYYKDSWCSLEQAYGEKGLLLVGFVYRGDRFRAARLESDLQKELVIPDGWRKLEEGEKMRWQDKVYTTSGSFSPFAQLNQSFNGLVGTNYDPSKLKCVIRRKPMKPEENGVRPAPLPGFRELVSGEPIRKDDLIWIHKVWMPPETSAVIDVYGELVTALYNPVEILVIRNVRDLVATSLTSATD